MGEDVFPMDGVSFLTKAFRSFLTKIFGTWGMGVSSFSKRFHCARGGSDEEQPSMLDLALPHENKTP